MCNMSNATARSLHGSRGIGAHGAHLPYRHSSTIGPAASIRPPPRAGSASLATTVDRPASQGQACAEILVEHRHALSSIAHGRFNYQTLKTNCLKGVQTCEGLRAILLHHGTNEGLPASSDFSTGLPATLLITVELRSKVVYGGVEGGGCCRRT